MSLKKLKRSVELRETLELVDNSLWVCHDVTLLSHLIYKIGIMAALIFPKLPRFIQSNPLTALGDIHHHYNSQAPIDHKTLFDKTLSSKSACP